MMMSTDLRPLNSTQNRYGTSIPEGRMSFHSPSEIPVVSRKSSGRNVPLSMRDVITDPAYIDKKLKSLSQNRDGDFKTHLKFLKYKFNPGD